jgi:ABC-type transporter Mla subunit MlaD
MPDTYDPYFVLSDVADNLWDLHQKTINSDKKTSDQAKSMYDTLESDYLEPIRRSKVTENTKKYAQIVIDLNAASGFIDGEIKRINKIVDAVKKVSDYAKIFDQILTTAAKLLAAA